MAVARDQTLAPISFLSIQKRLQGLLQNGVDLGIASRERQSVVPLLSQTALWMHDLLLNLKPTPESTHLDQLFSCLDN